MLTQTAENSTFGGGKTKEGGQYPVWSPDGDELFYRSPEGIMSVSVNESESAFDWNTPILLFANEYALMDIHPKDKRFLVLKPVTFTEIESAPEIYRKIRIVQNWFEELKEKVPVE